MLRRLPPQLRLLLHTVCIVPGTNQATCYSYDELDDKAKARALDHARYWQVEGIRWYDFVLEYAVRVGQILGIEIKAEAWNHPPMIYWDSRDSEVTFVGQWHYNPGCLAEIIHEVPQDVVLHEIAKLFDLKAVEARLLDAPYVSVTISYRRSTLQVEPADYFCDDDIWPSAEPFRMFARWIRQQLQAEEDYLTSDEYVAEQLRVNDHKFDEDGRMI